MMQFMDDDVSISKYYFKFALIACGFIVGHLDCIRSQSIDSTMD